MTYRLDTRPHRTGTQASFQGLLDAAALADLHPRLAALPAPVCLVLCSGTEVALPHVAQLHRLPVAELRVESPFLACWLRQDSKE